MADPTATPAAETLPPEVREALPNPCCEEQLAEWERLAGGKTLTGWFTRAVPALIAEVRALRAALSRALAARDAAPARESPIPAPDDAGPKCDACKGRGWVPHDDVPRAVCGTCDGTGYPKSWAAQEIARLDAEVATLTRERDEARACWTAQIRVAQEQLALADKRLHERAAAERRSERERARAEAAEKALADVTARLGRRVSADYGTLNDEDRAACDRARAVLTAKETTDGR